MDVEQRERLDLEVEALERCGETAVEHRRIENDLEGLKVGRDDGQERDPAGLRQRATDTMGDQSDWPRMQFLYKQEQGWKVCPLNQSY